MYSVSADYLTALASPVARFRLSGTVGSVSFTDENVVLGTFTINNNCSEGNEIKIGSVYVGQLKATFTGLSIARGSWLGKEITVSEGLQLADESFEDVPLGVYTVAEANHTLEGVEVVAYDNMTLFDKVVGFDQTSAEPFDILSLACTDCGVTLGMAQADVEALPNGTETLELFAENDIQTWRDLISWVALTLCAVATINRDGELELRQYSMTSDATIDESHRFTGCSFSDYACKYTGMSVVEITGQRTLYYHSTPDDGLTYNTGSNPLVQDDPDRVQAIINAFSSISLVPFSAKMLGGAIYDLCDCLTFSGGIANGAVCGVMAFVYSYNRGYSVEGYGSNPDLANAKSKTDKDIAGLSSQLDAAKIAHFTYTNASGITIADGASDTVVYYHIVAKSATWFAFECEIKHTAETTEVVSGDDYEENDLVVTATVSINGTPRTYQPVITEQDGETLIHLSGSFNAGAGALVVEISLECAGGNIAISAGDANCYLWGTLLEDLRLERIEVVNPPRNYVTFVGEAIDYDGVKVLGTYQDGTTSDLTALCTYDPADGTIATDEGAVTVQVEYTE